MTTSVVRQVLDNGLTVVVRPTHHAPVTTFWVWYRVGSRDETTGRTGVSHWVEHMLFKGSERFPKGEFDRLVSREGGTFNGMTWLDYTTYFETLPADRIDLALDIEADRMAGALFDPVEVESERTVIISEREGSENHPTFVLREEIQSTAIKVHPYHHHTLGWKGDLRTISRDDLWGHYRRHYHPANAVAVAVGPFDPARMVDRIAARFDHIPAGEPTAPVRAVEPEQRGERRFVVRGTDPTAYVAVAFRAPAVGDADYLACQVLTTVLGGAEGMSMSSGVLPNRSSRLYRALVDAGLATEVSCSMPATIDPFLYEILAVVRDGVDPAAVEAAILDEIDRLRRDGLSETELARARKQARAEFAYSSERVTDQGYWLGFAETVADLSWYVDYLDRLESVSVEDVVAAAGRHLDERRRTVGHYLPGPGAVCAGDDDREDE